MHVRGSTARPALPRVLGALLALVLVAAPSAALAAPASSASQGALQGTVAAIEERGTARTSDASPQSDEYFTATIKANGQDIPCTFKVLSRNGDTGTAETSVAANNDRAIDMETEGDLEIPDEVQSGGVTYRVTGIGDGSFWFCQKITSTGLAHNTSVESVGYRAYSACTALTDTGLATNASVKRLGNLCFTLDPALTSTGLATNRTLTEVSPSAFAGCEALTETGLATNTTVTKIGATAFAWCSSLTSTGLERNRSVTEVGDAAFVYCTSLESGLADNTTAKSQKELFYPAIAACRVTGLAASYPYTGSEVRPSVEVYDGAKKLDPASYSVSYSNNVEKGTATVTVTGTGGPSGQLAYIDSFNQRGIYETWSDYGGTLTATFKITDALAEGESIQGAQVDGIASYYSYTGSPVEPKPTVTLNGAALTEGVHYRVSYANNTQVGTASVTVSAIAPYTGSITRSFEIKTVYPPDSGTASTAGCTAVGLPGSFETSGARALVARVNEIRREAADLGLVSGYTPIQWSEALESAAQVRAAEASLGGYSLAHTRPNGSSCFTVENAGNMEILAWGSNMSQGLEMWYAEKDDYIRYKNGDTSLSYNDIGHYEALITAKSIGMSSFRNSATGRVAQAGCLGGGSTPVGTGRPVVGDGACVQQVYVRNDYLKGSVASATVPLGGTARLAAKISTTLDAGDYGPTTPLVWKSSNAAVASVDDSGTVTGVSKGSATVSASAGGWAVGSATVTVSDRAAGSFLDVYDGSWYKDAVENAYQQFYINGTGSTKYFSPDAQIKRCDAVGILYNMAGGDELLADGLPHLGDSYVTGFADVDGRAYYAKALAWARRAGVANGHDGVFEPEANLTREQFAAFLSNYAKATGRYSAPSWDAVSSLADPYTVDGWAWDAVNWAVTNKIMGKAGYAYGQSNISRAEVAAMAVSFQPRALVDSVGGVRPGERAH